MPAETFPQQALDSIAVHRSPDMFFRYRQTQARQILLPVVSCKHGKVPVRRSNGLVEYLFKILCRQQAYMARKTLL